MSRTFKTHKTGEYHDSECVSCVLGSDEDWSSHWGTSATIKQVTCAGAPYEQWCFVAAAAIGGAAYLTHRFVRAHHLMQAAAATSPAEKQRHVLAAYAAPHEVEAAAWYATRFKTRGAMIRLSAPLLWLAYLGMKHTTKRL
jgi:hypothetical protein